MLKHGILGLLSYGDMTGCEIREAFESSLKFFWPAQTSQIYRELIILEKNKWIEKHTVEQSGKPNKNICSITEEGQKELLRWLRDPDVHIDMRSPTLMKIFFLVNFLFQAAWIFSNNLMINTASDQRCSNRQTLLLHRIRK